MTALVRRALQLLPPLATTGIGSLPHTQSELALQAALQQDVPYLPQLPSGVPSELMIPAALEGLPGLSYDDDGACTVDAARWAAEGAAFTEALDAALSSSSLERFEPSVQACRAFRPFLWEVEHRKLPFAKVQLAGPCTVRWVAKTSQGDVASEVPGLDAAVYRLSLAKSLALVQAVRRAGATPILFLDEPGLYALDLANPRHLVNLQELKVQVRALQKEGALVGVHCCSNTHWRALLDADLDLLSLDVRLSLDALLEERAACVSFFERGGALSLGVVPTDVASEYEVSELAESVEASLRACLPPRLAFADVLARSLLTPACGLAMRTVVESERILEELKRAQALLRAAADAHPGASAQA